MRKINLFWLLGSVAIIDVATKRYPRASALIDAVDVPLILDGAGRWCATKDKRSFYAIRGVGSSRQAMHRVLLPGTNILRDHRNRDGLDNRRKNLRIANARQNRVNSKHRECQSGYRGVYHRHKLTDRFYARIEDQHLGAFQTAEEAARAYDCAALERYGEFAHLNFSRGELR